MRKIDFVFIIEANIMFDTQRISPKFIFIPMVLW